MSSASHPPPRRRFSGSSSAIPTASTNHLVELYDSQPRLVSAKDIVRVVDDHHAASDENTENQPLEDVIASESHDDEQDLVKHEEVGLKSEVAESLRSFEPLDLSSVLNEGVEFFD